MDELHQKIVDDQQRVFLNAFDKLNSPTKSPGTSVGANSIFEAALSQANATIQASINVPKPPQGHKLTISTPVGVAMPDGSEVTLAAPIGGAPSYDTTCQQFGAGAC